MDTTTALVDGRWVVQGHRTSLLEALGALRPDGRTVRWVVREPDPADDEAAAAVGLENARDVLQLRRPLPVDATARDGAPVAAVRPFRPGTGDEEAWIACNNRSFASHPDQSGFTLERLHGLMAEPWFDASGLLLHESGGRVGGFCWTKVHAEHDPPLGEIYVIGVDPDLAGRRLGWSLTLAGLDVLSARGLRVGMLYVDADNAPARRLYDRLGFRLHHVDRLYESRPPSGG